MRKLGRQPRKFNPHIPHYSALRLNLRDLAPPPAEVDYTKGMPADFGMMANDSLGDCTCAAFYHARQVWSYNTTGYGITESAPDVIALYEQACGYNPNDPATDNGGAEQDVLAFLLNTGAPVDNPSAGRDKILAYLEIDYRNLDDLKRCIYDCGIAYIGIDVPASVMDNADDPSIAWDVIGNQESQGGHAIVLVGYNADFFYCISWGKKYKITPAFLTAHLEEAYAIASPDWIEATGKTPLGMTVEDLEAQMEDLKEN